MVKQLNGEVVKQLNGEAVKHFERCIFECDIVYGITIQLDTV
jgi:hypothetical protein